MSQQGPYVIFLRAANVGGHQVFSPKEFAAAHGWRNIGAAGTFVANATQEAIEDALKQLPFAPEAAVVAQTDLAAAIEDVVQPDGVKTEVSVVVSGDPAWEDAEGLRLAARRDPFVITQRVPGGRIFAAEILEKNGSRVTTRTLATMRKC